MTFDCLLQTCLRGRLEHRVLLYLGTYPLLDCKVPNSRAIPALIPTCGKTLLLYEFSVLPAFLRQATEDAHTHYDGHHIDVQALGRWEDHHLPRWFPWPQHEGNTILIDVLFIEYIILWPLNHPDDVLYHVAVPPQQGHRDVVIYSALEKCHAYACKPLACEVHPCSYCTYICIFPILVWSN